jgi:hypothetical protein
MGGGGEQRSKVMQKGDFMKYANRAVLPNMHKADEQNIRQGLLSQWVQPRGKKKKLRLTKQKCGILHKETAP